MRFSRLLVIGSLLLCGLQRYVAADDFRIETKVFSGKNKTPVSENRTLFHAGYVYDYLLSGPERIAVFDKPHGRFILLDPARKIKAEVKIDDVTAFTDKFHDWAAKNRNAFLKFAADPTFETNLSEKGELTLTSSHISYRLETTPAHSPEAAQQYREFSDWYARFNAMSHPGSTPPFARLVVNEELAERELIPTEVQLTIPAQTTLGVRAVSMHSEHHVSWRLLQRDTEKIAETANQLAAFKLVEFDEFDPAAVIKR